VTSAISCKNIHTHIDKLQIERMVWSFACTLLTLHTPCTPNTPCKRPPILQQQPRVWHCMHPWSSTKTVKWKWKNDGRISKFGIHTAWRIIYQALQTHAICPTPLPHKKQSHATTPPWHSKWQITKSDWHVAKFVIFVTFPERVVTTNKYFLTFCIKNFEYFNLLYQEYSWTMVLPLSHKLFCHFNGT